MEATIFRKWLADRGCSFEPEINHGHACLTVYSGEKKATLPEFGTHKVLDPRTIRRIIEDLGLNLNELPDLESRDSSTPL